MLRFARRAKTLMKNWKTFALILLLCVVCFAQRPGATGDTWQIKATLLTGTPTPISSMAGSPPPANKDICVSWGSVSQATASSATTITITSGDGGQAWPAVPVFLGASGTQGAVTVLWNAGSTINCEWMPQGMSVSTNGTGVYFKASGYR